MSLFNVLVIRITIGFCAEYLICQFGSVSCTCRRLTGVAGDHENLEPQKSTMECVFSYLCTSMNGINLFIWQNYSALINCTCTFTVRVTKELINVKRKQESRNCVQNKAS